MKFLIPGQNFGILASPTKEMDTFLFQMSMKWMFTFKSFRNVYWHGKTHSALIALVKIVPSVLLDMPFEVGSCVAQEVAVCATVRFLPCVNEGVGLQIAVLSKWLVTLKTTELLDPTVCLLVIWKTPFTCKWEVAVCASVRFLPSVREGVSIQMSFSTKWLVTLWALVRFLSGVNEGVRLQIAVPTKWLVTLFANVFFDPTVCQLVIGKALPTCTCLWTQVTIYLIGHLVTSTLFCRPPITVLSCIERIFIN